jgi:hypothetical protein
MKVTTDNYEEFFLDYHEGRLSEEEEQDLRSFLVLHPELRQEFDAFEHVLLEVEQPLSFPDKNKLRKNPLHEPEHIVAYMEGDLSARDSAAFEKALRTDRALERELHLFHRTRLEADATIVFPSRNRLKKGRVVRLLYPVAAIAAAIALLLVFSRTAPLPETSLQPVASAPSGHPLPLPAPAEKAQETSSRKAVRQRAAYHQPAQLARAEAPSRLPLLSIREPALAAFHQKPALIEEPSYSLRSPYATEKEQRDEDSYPDIRKAAQEFVKKKLQGIVKKDMIARVAAVNENGLENLTRLGLSSISLLTGTEIQYEKTSDSTGVRSTLIAGDFEFSRIMAK